MCPAGREPFLSIDHLTILSYRLSDRSVSLLLLRLFNCELLSILLCLLLFS
jgi:hypothetical protein